jgi:hypothetical protein
MKHFVNQFGLAKSSLFANVLDTADPKPKSRPSFIEYSLMNAGEIHETDETFLSKYSIKHFENAAKCAQMHSPLRAKDETFCKSVWPGEEFFICKCTVYY